MQVFRSFLKYLNCLHELCVDQRDKPACICLFHLTVWKHLAYSDVQKNEQQTHELWLWVMCLPPVVSSSYCGWMEGSYANWEVESFHNEHDTLEAPDWFHSLFFLLFSVCWNALGQGCSALVLWRKHPVGTHSLWSHTHQLSQCSITLYGYGNALTMAALYLSVRVCVCVCKSQQLMKGICSSGTIKGSQRGGGKELQSSIFAPFAFLFMSGLT